MRLLPAKPGASEKEGAPLRRSIPVKSTEVVICTPQQRLAFMATSVHWKKIIMMRSIYVFRLTELFVSVNIGSMCLEKLSYGTHSTMCAHFV